ncbi:MAG: MMPL family transporter [Planctomycetales bacterium]|nr:MMPL family transporter [Planctomycetales bacterium]
MILAWYKVACSKLVTRYWPVVILTWLVVVIVLRATAPAWNSIAADGDLAFLPPDSPSSIGQHNLEEAFPGAGTKSQLILVFASPIAEEPLTAGDLAMALDVARQLHYMAARNAWEKLSEQPIQELGHEIEASGVVTRQSVLIETVLDNASEAIEIDKALAQFVESEIAGRSFQRLPDVYWWRAKALEAQGDFTAAAESLDTHALILEQKFPLQSLPADSWTRAIGDVWSWRNAIVGHKLGSQDPNARLVSVNLATEFTATGNIAVLEGIEGLMKALRSEYSTLISSHLRTEVSGSAAIGADMLRAASSGVRQTEWVTVVLVLVILATVYRGPFLVAIPLTSIAVSLLVATSVIALLAKSPTDPSSWGLGVFTTTRIFIVVLLFGAGTDFCLFFLARSRELLVQGLVNTRAQLYRMIAKAWYSVHDALVASALTTIVGLALMWFSDFQKFQFSGPIIAISLAVTLIVCLTFTPAMLSALGLLAFWPIERRGRMTSLAVDGYAVIGSGRWQAYWRKIAEIIVGRPKLAMITTLFILGLPATYGFFRTGSVTYDLTEELSSNAPSRRGAKLISEFFPSQDASPITFLLTRQQPFEDMISLQAACNELSDGLYIDGVDSVRSLTDPLGDYPPDRRMGLFDSDAWRRRILTEHRITRERYISSTVNLALRVARFDMVVRENAFSLAASDILDRLLARVDDFTHDPQSPWFGATVSRSGTTVGIADLRRVTQADQRRIQVLVTLGVWLVLILILRKLALSTYLVMTVLLSYFTTLGITYGTFSTLYAGQYTGLDWKVPLFLFVILVAVGQDYNVYLVTRIFEEWKRFGLQEGVRRAITQTGGIITSCGVVMAGTFIAMASPAILQALASWIPLGIAFEETPVLRGITELGFALSLGVLLDTFIVRSILVPSFIVLWQQCRELVPRRIN